MEGVVFFIENTMTFFCGITMCMIPRLAMKRKLRFLERMEILRNRQL